VERYCIAGHATDDNMAHALCMLGTKGYKHTLTLCNTHCFSSTTVVARKRRSVTLYVPCSSCCSCCLTLNCLTVFALDVLKRTAVRVTSLGAALVLSCYGNENREQQAVTTFRAAHRQMPNITWGTRGLSLQICWGKSKVTRAQTAGCRF
jgi:hypothetical protein